MQDTELFKDDELMFLGEDSDESPEILHEPWRVLIVDDEPDIHSMTTMVLGDFIFENRNLEFLSAFSGEESLSILNSEKDIAVVLLDVVMESNTAGLTVAASIRDTINNPFIRIILRTGQPGFAPEHKVITELDINDYWQKAELTSQRLSTSLTSALRSYRDLLKIERNRTSLSQLAVSVAHQIRNRTMTIHGFANIAARKLEPDSDVQQYLKTISEETLRLEMIVDSVSEFTAIENCEHDNVEVETACNEVLADIKEYAESLEKNVKFDVELQNVVIDAKPDLFKKVLEELLKNAVVFSSTENPHVEIAVRSGFKTCIIEISDNGTGVAEKDIPYVFDPFFTLRPEAVGMGLSIVNRIISGYNWDINVLRSQDGGAMFSLRISL
ncbi:sensor histidine kinase [Maridesulfovibrio zosterae]|uniref:sensor histidine kinase n=1 Tax=Maridesulfovibrio zosterae TaxID=82171 RepID=UPI0004217794|nr:hybrid sensor histidine kinase/response regulator [Maridesulfovibrio zosterae]